MVIGVVPGWTVGGGCMVCPLRRRARSWSLVASVSATLFFRGCPTSGLLIVLIGMILFYKSASTWSPFQFEYRKSIEGKHETSLSLRSHPSDVLDMARDEI